MKRQAGLKLRTWRDCARAGHVANRTSAIAVGKEANRRFMGEIVQDALGGGQTYVPLVQNRDRGVWCAFASAAIGFTYEDDMGSIAKRMRRSLLCFLVAACAATGARGAEPA